jgi:hypothetical protein
MIRPLCARVALVLLAVALMARPVGARIVLNTIGATAALIGEGHVLRGTVLLACTPGEQIQFTLTLAQGGTSGTGQGAGVCTGDLTPYEVTIEGGDDTFTPGFAEACATADNYRRGALVESKQWCRATGVVLSAE